MKFSQAKIGSIVIPPDKLKKLAFPEHIEFDDDMPGFGVRVREGNHRTFIVQYKIGSKHRRISLGDVRKVTLEHARREAKKIFGKVANSQDPANDKAHARQAASHTFDAAVKKYLEARKGDMRPSTLVQVTHHLETLWKPLHSLALGSITRAHVAPVMSGIAKERGPVAANRARANLSAFFAWAMGEGLCDNNPVIGTNKQTEDGSRDRALSMTEAAKVWLGAPKNDYGRIVRLLLLTGCRRDEIGGLRWSEVDLKGRTITLPGDRTKNGRAHVISLSEPAAGILATIDHRANRDLVFGFGEGGFSGWSKSKAALGVKLAEEWTLHDLRRTVATRMADIGVQPHVIEALLNHVSGHKAGVAGVYNLSTYAEEKKVALDLWASHLQIAVAQASGANVTTLRKGRS
jgi:integrase